MTRLAPLLHPADRDPMTRLSDRYAASRNVTVVGALVNSTLAVTKVGCGVVANSQALVADGLHSFSDLATDAIVLVAARKADRAPDRSHPYGHGRIETAMTLALGVVLLATALAIGYGAVVGLQHPGPAPSTLAVWVALLSIGANEGLFFYTLQAANRVNSKLLRANAWHHRTDSISSVVVLIGVAGSMAGLPYLDPVAAVGVAMMIAKVGWDTSWAAVRELTDEALEQDEVVDIRQLIEGVEGVRDLHMLRSRQAGAYALVDVHVIVDPRLTVSEGHRIAERIRDRVVHGVDKVADVLVHVDSEDDRGALLGRHLPLRDEMLRIIREAIASQPVAHEVQDIRLHYQRDQIEVEMVLPLAGRAPETARQCAADLVEVVHDLPHVASVQVLFTPGNKCGGSGER